MAHRAWKTGTCDPLQKLVTGHHLTTATRRFAVPGLKWAARFSGGLQVLLA